MLDTPNEQDMGAPTILLNNLSRKQIPVSPANTIMIPHRYANGRNANSPTRIMVPIVSLVKLMHFIRYSPLILPKHGAR